MHVASTTMCDDESMGTVWPAGQIRHRQRHIARLICVLDEGHQGGGVGRVSWESFRNTTHGRVRVTVFFS